MPSADPSVHQARKGLADRLREIRLRVVEPERMTTTRLARLAGWHQTKVSKLEHCVTSPSVEDIRIWCDLCDVGPEETENLIATGLAVTSSYMEWKRRRREGMKRVQQSYVPLWERTTRFHIYESSIIPGLFQTPGYARAVLQAIVHFNRIPDDVGEAVKARIERRKVVTEGKRTFAVLIEENALYTRYGLDQHVLAEQLAYLLTVMSWPNVSLGIIPREADRTSIWPLNGFWIYDSDRVITELLTAEITITQPSEVEPYQRAYSELTALSARDETARRLILRAIAALA
ncbi:MAG: helix-turn-helix transcriptional regulator [Streptosporangiaceae bacterium]